jgi:hypothetical protein
MQSGGGVMGALTAAISRGAPTYNKGNVGKN